jgi:hypothetical protein
MMGNTPKTIKMTAFAPVIRIERLTMTLYDKEIDRLFLTDLWNSYAESSPDTFVWVPELIDRLMRNTVLSPETCNGMEVSRPSVSYACHWTKIRSINPQYDMAHHLG